MQPMVLDTQDLDQLMDDNFKEITYDNIRKDMYFISPTGDIFSKYKASRKSKSNFLSPKLDKYGYLVIALRTEENKPRFFTIHQLVALTYLGCPPDYMKDPTVNHKDGNRLNNHYSNLEWIERSVNSSIRKNKGYGVLNHEAKLTEIQVEEICELLINSALTLEQIGRLYGVNKSTIHHIKCHKSWKYITNKYVFSCRKSIRVNGRFNCINTNLL